jgi:hypothetical protein
MIRCGITKMKKCFGLALTHALLLALLAPSICQATPEATLPEGTRITLQLNKNLSTKTNREGDSFTAVVTMPVNLGDRMVIPKGSVVNCSISRIVRPGRFQGKAQMNFLFQSIDIPGHGRIPVVATLVKVDPEGNSGIRSGTEGSIEGEGSSSRNVGRILTPAIIGGGIGAVAGGGRGAGIGAGVGAVIGLTSVFSSGGKDLEIHRGSNMDVELVRPLVVPAEEEDDAARNR